MPVRPMLSHRMALVSKIWETCKNFLGKWFTSPGGEGAAVQRLAFQHDSRFIASSLEIEEQYQPTPQAFSILSNMDLT